MAIHYTQSVMDKYYVLYILLFVQLYWHYYIESFSIKYSHALSILEYLNTI